jgi:tetratricopeptide (TPR) repeat protein
MSVRELRCQHCKCDGVFESIGPFGGGASYAVTWRCPQCKDSMVDVCSIGPIVPTETLCLNCAGSYDKPGEDPVCNSCALPRSEAHTFLGLDKTPDDPVKGADEMFKKGLYRRGIATLNLTILKGRATEDVWVLKSLIFRSLGYDQSELLVLEAAIAAGVKLDVQYGIALQRAGRHRDAATVYERFVKNNPGHAWAGVACCNHANALKDLGEDSAAEKLYQKAIQIDAGRPTHYLSYAYFLRQQGRWSDAIDVLNKGLKDAAASEHTARFHEDKSYLLAEEGRPNDAIESAEAALALNPGGLRATFLHGRALAAAGRKSEARDDFQKVLASDPENYEAKAALDCLSAPSFDKRWFQFWK